MVKYKTYEKSCKKVQSTSHFGKSSKKAKKDYEKKERNFKTKHKKDWVIQKTIISWIYFILFTYWSIFNLSLSITNSKHQ
jgi:hypothetical protein